MMKRRLFRGAAAVALSLAVLLPASVQPAQADDTRPGSARLVAFAQAILELLAIRIPGGVDLAEISSLLIETTSEINEAKDEIIANSEGWHTAEALAIMDRTLAESWMMRYPSESTKIFYASRALHGASLAGRDIEVAQTQPALDALGHALIVGYSVGGAAATSLRWPSFNDDMRAYKGYLNLLRTKMKPECSLSLKSTIPMNQTYSCRAHDGTVATGEEL
jgi:hypothetical protein